MKVVLHLIFNLLLCLCLVPENLHLILEQYTQQGFRVIALAYKELDESVGTQDWRKVSR